ncbi:hypothetical protein GCM10028778_11940 [Barrientosiimonas marina]|uniref:DUF5342 family protein n=1 Tax=Lentibacillus kimchii TaxID=1542911 RepID=A0ABW2UXT9_9BACI
MFNDFQIKPMLANTVYQYLKFDLVLEGKKYQGLYNKGNIRWFQPKPLSEELSFYSLHDVEEEVHRRINDFQIRPILANTVYQHWKFDLVLEGKKYQGLYDKGNIRWFQPKPLQEEFSFYSLHDVEEEVHRRIKDELNQ